MATIRELTEGMAILAKYMGGDEAHIGGAEHDTIYVCPPDVKVSSEDALKLTDLGWHWDSETGWLRFV